MTIYQLQNTRDVKVSRPGLGLGPNLIVIGLGLGLGLI